MRIALIWLLLAAPLWADNKKAGQFDYYVLALSWSPNWCAREGQASNAQQCGAHNGHGWILHGLWPQYERGYPSNCRTSHPNPSRSQTQAMRDIMGSAGLAWHQWKKHGRCSGLSARDYFALSRKAYTKITRPQVLRELESSITIRPSVIEDAFIDANPLMQRNTITITCRNNYIQEARVCLTKDLAFRPCSDGTIRDCQRQNQKFEPVQRAKN